MARSNRKTASRAKPRAAATLRATPRAILERGVLAAADARRTAMGVLNTLVERGSALQARGRKLALAKANAARAATLAGADEARQRAVEVVSRLEKVFEQRVSRAISKLGVPTSRDVRALSRQVSQLQTSVEQLRRARARA